MGRREAFEDNVLLADQEGLAWGHRLLQGLGVGLGVLGALRLRQGARRRVKEAKGSNASEVANGTPAGGATDQAGASANVATRGVYRASLAQAAQARKKKQHKGDSRGPTPVHGNKLDEVLDQLLEQQLHPKKWQHFKQLLLAKLQGLQQLEEAEQVLHQELQQVLQLVPELQANCEGPKLTRPAATAAATLVVLGQVVDKQQQDKLQHAQSEHVITQLQQDRADLQAQLAAKNDIIQQQQNQQVVLQLELAASAVALEQLKGRHRQLKQLHKQHKLQTCAAQVRASNMQATIKSLHARCGLLQRVLFPSLTFLRRECVQQLAAEYQASLAAKDAALVQKDAARKQLVTQYEADKVATQKHVEATVVAHLRDVSDKHKAKCERLVLQEAEKRQQLVDMFEATCKHLDTARQQLQVSEGKRQAAEDKAAEKSWLSDRDTLKQLLTAANSQSRKHQPASASKDTEPARAVKQQQRQKQATRMEVALLQSELARCKAHMQQLAGAPEHAVRAGLKQALSQPSVRRPWVMPAIDEADEQLSEDESEPHEPAPQGDRGVDNDARSSRSSDSDEWSGNDSGDAEQALCYDSNMESSGSASDAQCPCHDSEQTCSGSGLSSGSSFCENDEEASPAHMRRATSDRTHPEQHVDSPVWGQDDGEGNRELHGEGEDEEGDYAGEGEEGYWEDEEGQGEGDMPQCETACDSERTTAVPEQHSTATHQHAGCGAGRVYSCAS